MKKPRGIDCFTEGKATGREDDDRPEEVIEVFFREDTGTEEENERDDSNDAHITEEPVQLMAYAPKDNCA